MYQSRNFFWLYWKGTNLYLGFWSSCTWEQDSCIGTLHGNKAVISERHMVQDRLVAVHSVHHALVSGDRPTTPEDVLTTGCCKQGKPGFVGFGLRSCCENSMSVRTHQTELWWCSTVQKNVTMT